MIGGWIRFAVGLLLAAEIIRQIINNECDLVIAGILSVVYIALGVAYFALKF